MRGGRQAEVAVRSRHGRPDVCIDVYRGVMSRTNVDVDDALVDEAMRRYHLPSKRAAIDLALRRLVGDGMDSQEALEMEGSGWDADLEELRSNSAADVR